MAWYTWEGGVVRDTGDAAPLAWKRFVALMLDACRAECAPPLPPCAAPAVAAFPQAQVMRRKDTRQRKESYGANLRGTSLRGANMLVPFHEVYTVRTHDGQVGGLPQMSYIAFVSQARNQATGALAHVHWFTHTEDPASVPGKYRDGRLAHVTRSQTFAKERRGQTQVRETFSAVADGGAVHLSLAYEPGGMVVWATADKPNLPLHAAMEPGTVSGFGDPSRRADSRRSPGTGGRRSRCRRSEGSSGARARRGQQR